MLLRKLWGGKLNLWLEGAEPGEHETTSSYDIVAVGYDDIGNIVRFPLLLFVVWIWILCSFIVLLVFDTHSPRYSYIDCQMANEIIIVSLLALFYFGLFNIPVVNRRCLVVKILRGSCVSLSPPASFSGLRLPLPRVVVQWLACSSFVGSWRRCIHGTTRDAAGASLMAHQEQCIDVPLHSSEDIICGNESDEKKLSPYTVSDDTYQ